MHQLRLYFFFIFSPPINANISVTFIKSFLYETKWISLKTSQLNCKELNAVFFRLYKDSTAWIVFICSLVTTYSDWAWPEIWVKIRNLTALSERSLRLPEKYFSISCYPNKKNLSILYIYKWKWLSIRKTLCS